MSKPRVAVTMLHWGRPETTAAALASLGYSTYPEVDIYLVDQGQQLELTLPKHVTLIKTADNLGYAKGHNLAIRQALARGGYDYILTLNNDVTVAPDFLDLLVAAMAQHPKAAAVGPTILYDDPPDDIWYGGGEYDPHGGRARHLNLRRKLSELTVTKPVPVTFVTGCATLLRVAALRQVGLYDDQGFIYWEDLDWCVRAQEQGWQLYYQPKALVTHHVSSSLNVNSPRYLYYIFRNNLLFIRRHTPWPWKLLAWWYLKVLVAKEIVKLFVRYRRDYSEYLRMIWLAYYHNAIRRYGQL
jgi:GT2 family glycosyltransferase